MRVRRRQRLRALGVHVAGERIHRGQRPLLGDNHRHVGILVVAETRVHADQREQLRRLQILPQPCEHVRQVLRILRRGRLCRVALPLHPHERAQAERDALRLRRRQRRFRLRHQRPVARARRARIVRIPILHQRRAAEGRFHDGQRPAFPRAELARQAHLRTEAAFGLFKIPILARRLRFCLRRGRFQRRAFRLGLELRPLPAAHNIIVVGRRIADPPPKHHVPITCVRRQLRRIRIKADRIRLPRDQHQIARRSGPPRARVTATGRNE